MAYGPDGINNLIYQVSNANEKQALCRELQLYNLFKGIEAGFVTKEEVLKLLKSGSRDVSNTTLGCLVRKKEKK